MRKRIVALLLAIMTVAAFSACGKKGGETANGGETEDSSTLAQMEPANATKTLVEKYGSIVITSVDADGYESKTCMQTTEGGYNLIIQDDSGVEIAMTPKGNFILTSDGESSVDLYEDEAAYAERKEEIITAPVYSHNSSEEVVEETEEGGKTTVLAVLRMTSSTDGYEEFKNLWGIDDEEFDYYNQYVVDTETLEILESSSYCELSTGKRELNHTTITHGEALELSDAMKKLIENSK